MDWFSNLPPGILENILCFLPIQEAARTSILSREWRYRWIKIPKLEFEEFKFHVSTDGAESNGADLEQMSDQTSKRKDLIKRRKFFYAICQVLLMHEGPLHEFTLNMRPCDQSFIDDELVEIDSIIFHLSRKNTVKKLAIDNEWGWYKLPFSLFSFRHLTDLRLGGCAFSHLPTFNVFGSLTSLSLEAVHISIKKLLHLLSNCPMLKTMTLVNEMYMRSGYPTVSDNPAIFDLFGCLPVIESLSIPFTIFQWFKSCVHHKVPRELPTKLNHLKYLYLYEVCFTRKDGLSILVLFMKSSPKLEKIEIDNIDFEEGNSSSEEDNLLTEDDLCSFTLGDYSDIWLEHMSELHITSRSIFGSELNFVKLILAKSPVLKKVTIKLDYRELDEDEELQILQVLLSSPRASPVVEIII